MREEERGRLARLSLFLNWATGGDPEQYLCARMAEIFGPYSWQCRLIDRLSRQEAHCRKQLFDWRYRK